MSPFLSNWLKEAQIIFRRIFQKDYRTIHLLISYLFIFQITSSVFEVVCGVEYEHLVLRLLNHSFLSPMFLHVFMSYYALSWVFSSLRFCDILILECHTTFINNLWILWGSTFFFCCIYDEERTALRDVLQNIFTIIMKNARFHVSWK